MIKKLTLVICISMLASLSTIASNLCKFDTLQTNNGVEFFYKWKNSKIFDKASPLKLIVKIKNTNDYSAEVTYTVDYFWQGLTKASSDKITRCILGKKQIVINAKKQGYDTSIFTTEEINSEDFMMELNGISVIETDRCE